MVVLVPDDYNKIFLSGRLVDRHLEDPSLTRYRRFKMPRSTVNRHLTLSLSMSEFIGLVGAHESLNQLPSHGLKNRTLIGKWNSTL